jgi:hypothetical protein
MSKIQNVQNMDSMLIQSGKMLALDKKLELVGLTEEDLEDVPKEQLMVQQGMNMGTPKTSKDKPQSDQGVGKAGAKRQEQQNSIASRGKPSGYGKEIWELQKEIFDLKTFLPKVIQKAIVQTRYENQPKLRKDQPIKQFADNNQSHIGKQDSALATDGSGPEMPANWAIKRDNKVNDGQPEPNLYSSPQITRQLSTYPTGSITTENMFNPAGNLNYSSDDVAKRDGDSPYMENQYDLDMDQDYPGAVVATKPVKRKGKYPSTRGVGVDESYHLANNYNSSKKEIIVHNFDHRLVSEYQGVMGENAELVNLKTFIQLYSEDQSSGQGQPPRIFLRQKDNNIILKYKSSDFVYKTIMTSEEWEKDISIKMLLYSISGKIYRV